MSRRETTKELLVALLPTVAALDRLKAHRWYHIPVASAPKRWPPKILAFYQGQPFGEEAYSIRYYGKVAKIDTLPRGVLFPDEEPNEKTEMPYYRLELETLEVRKPSIPSLRPRRLVFVPTTLAKFNLAEQINDLFDDSRLEDLMWNSLKGTSIPAERQWRVRIRAGTIYYLDFAVFCTDGKLGLEVDGYATHAGEARSAADKWRQNEIEIDDWRILRYGTNKIMEGPSAYLPQVQEMITHLGGLEKPTDFTRRVGELQAEYIADSEFGIE